MIDNIYTTENNIQSTTEKNLIETVEKKSYFIRGYDKFDNTYKYVRILLNSSLLYLPYPKKVMISFCEIFVYFLGQDTLGA